MTKQLFTINEAAKLLGVSIKTLRRWDQKGLLSAQRTIGNQRRYAIEDLEVLKGKKVKSVIHKKQVERARQVTIAEAAAFLGISVKTLRRWEAKGIVSSHRSPTNQRFFLTNELSKLKETKIETKVIEPVFQQPVNVAPTPVFNPTHSYAEKHMRFAGTFFSLLGILLTIAAFGASMNLPQLSTPMTKLLSFVQQLSTHDKKAGSGNEVLATQTQKRDYALKVSVPAEFFSTASVSGKLTAPNILYGVVAGTNITISGDAQNPTISTSLTDLAASGVTAGTGINIDGTTITNTDLGSSQNIFKNIKVGSTTISAGSNTDTFELAAGSGITLSSDTSNKKVTITNSSTALSGLTTYGVLYADSATTAVSLTPGTSGYILQSNGTGAAPSWIAPSAQSSIAFTDITSGTNTTAAMVVGSGASLTYSGGTATSGVINANQLLGSTWAAPPAIGSTTPASGTFTALSGSGAITFSSFTTSGGLLYTNGSGVLSQTAAGSATTVLHGGTTPSYSAVDLTADISGILPIANGGSPFEQSNGAITERNTTQDFLLGATSTSSAKFAVINVAGGTPIASLSGTTGGTYLTADGKIATTNKQNLTIGDSTTTGDVILNPAGNIGIKNVAPGTTLDVTGTGRFSSTLTASNGFTLTTGALNLTASSGSVGLTLTSATNAFGVNAGLFDIDTTNSRVGINTSSPLSAFDVRSTSGTLSVATVSGQTSFASLLVDNSGAGDLFTASQSGITRFVITPTGNLAFTGNTASLNTITSLSTVAQTITVPDTGGTGGTLCLTTGNCAGVGGNGDVVSSGASTDTALVRFNGVTGKSIQNSGVLLDASNNMTGVNSLSITPATNITGLTLTGTNVTSSKLVYLNAKNSSGTIFDISYGAAQTLTGSLIGQAIDLNNGQVTATNQNVTGQKITLPTVTNTNAVGTENLLGLQVTFGSGAGINQNGAGATVFSDLDVTLPALTQTSGTLTANGLAVTTPSSITTNGTANGILISPTGVGAGTLNGVNVATISAAGAGNETALNVGSGWDTVLRVNGTPVINGQGITLPTGGGTGLSSYTTGDILYASGTNVLSALAGGVANNGKVLVVAGGVPAWGTMAGSSCTDCVLNDPTSSTTNTIAPTGAGTTGLIVKQTSTASPTNDIFRITDSTGSVVYFSVDKNGNVNPSNTIGNTLTLTPTTDTTALTLVGTNVPTASLQYINSKNQQGTIFNLAYGAVQTLSTSTALTGIGVDLSTNVTATNATVTGESLTLPSATNTITSGTKYLKGVTISAGGGLNQNGAGGTTTFEAFDATIPALTQTAGTLNGYGVNITTPSSITTGGTAAALNVSASGVGAGNLYGLNISSITAGAGTETALNIGSGWDNVLKVNGTTVIDGSGNLNVANATGILPIANGGSPFEQAAGAIFPRLPTQDLLIGGVATTSATFHVFGSINSGTNPVASVAGMTSFASLVVNNSGAGDLFTASSSGLNRFVIAQNGNVGIGTTLPSAQLQITQNNVKTGGFLLTGAGSASINDATLFKVMNSNSTVGIQYSEVLRQTKMLGGNSVFHTPATYIQTNGDDRGGLLIAGNSDSQSADLLQVFSSNTNGDYTQTSGMKFRVNPSGTLYTASVSGTTSFAALVVDNAGAGDLFTASSSGLSRFVIKQNGNIGIGTTLPTADIHLVKSNGYNVRLDPGSSQLGYLTFAEAGVDIFRFAYDGSPGISPNNLLKLQTDVTGGAFGTNALTFAQNGTIAVDSSTTPRATLDILGASDTLAVASVSGKSNSFAALVVDNKGTGDIFTASRGGKTVFTVGFDRVQIGTGSATGAGGAETPQLLGLDSKGSTGDPSGGRQGDMYYNTVDEKFRCYQATGWTDCIAASASEYLSAVRQGVQDGTEVDSASDHINYNVATGSGTAIFLDTSSAYAQGGSGASRGRFTLAAGRTYHLKAQVPYALFGGTNGSLDITWYNVTTGNTIGSAGGVEPVTGGSNNNRGSGTAEAIITTTTTTTVEVRLIQITSLSSIGDVSTAQLNPTAYIDVISGAQSVSASEYLRAEMRTIQSTNTGDSNVAGVPDHVKFDNVDAFSGSSIQLDTSTTYSKATASASIGKFTLQAGKTYKLHADISQRVLMSGALPFLLYGWYNDTTSTLLGSTGSVAPTNYSGDTRGEYSMADAIITPSVTTTVEVRFVDMNNGTLTSVGYTSSTLKIYPNAMIEVISDGTQVAQFTGATSIADGAIGYVPAPVAGQQGSLLLGNGTWTAATNVKIGTTLTEPIASLSASTTFAGLVVNNNGSGDLFTASSSGLNRFVITQNGNVGIGTALPSQKLHLLGTTDATTAMRIEATNTGANTYAEVNFANSARQYNMGIGGSGVTSALKNSFYIYDNTAPNTRFLISPIGTVGIGGGTSNTPIATLDLRGVTASFPVASISGATNAGFASLVVTNSGSGDLFTASSSGLNRFVITQAGNVGIGTTTPDYPLRVEGSISHTTNNYGYLNAAGAGTFTSITTGYSAYFANSIRVAGEVHATSDQREKNLVDTIDPEVALDAVTKLRPLHFQWKPEYNRGDTVIAGFFAQDIEHIIPEAVQIQQGDFFPDERSLSYNQLTTVAISALQGLNKKVDATNSALFRNLALTPTGDLNVNANNIDTLSLNVSGNLQAQNLTLGGTNVNDKLIGLEGGIASLSAGFASPLASLQTQVLSLSDRVASLEATLNTLTSSESAALLSNLSYLSNLNGFTASSGAELSLDKLNVNGSIISDSLNVLGYTTLNELSVTGSIRTGVLTINGQSNGGASISTLNGDLRLQDQGFGGIDILNGLVTIDTSGNIQTTGEITAKKFNVDTTDVSAASAGSIVITAGVTTIDVNTTALTPDSLIFVTPNKPVVIGADKKDANTFTIKLQSPAATNIKVNWWIVN